MLAAVLDKPSNLSDLAQWNLTSNSYKLNMTFLLEPLSLSLSLFSKYRLKDRLLPCLDAAVFVSWFAMSKYIKSASRGKTWSTGHGAYSCKRNMS